MKRIFGAVLAVAALSVIPAHAASKRDAIVSEGRQVVTLKDGRSVEVHMMKMGNGHVMYAIGKSDLDQLFERRSRELSNY